MSIDMTFRIDIGDVGIDVESLYQIKVF